MSRPALDGTDDPALFNPRELDCRQWVRAAKAAGVTRMILTAKHHGGFCLWTVAADDVAFDNVVNSRQQQVVSLATPVAARYVRLTALRTVNDNDLASAADVSVLVE